MISDPRRFEGWFDEVSSDSYERSSARKSKGKNSAGSGTKISSCLFPNQGSESCRYINDFHFSPFLKFNVNFENHQESPSLATGFSFRFLSASRIRHS